MSGNVNVRTAVEDTINDFLSERTFPPSDPPLLVISRKYVPGKYEFVFQRRGPHREYFVKYSVYLVEGKVRLVTSEHEFGGRVFWQVVEEVKTDSPEEVQKALSEFVKKDIGVCFGVRDSRP